MHWQAIAVILGGIAAALTIVGFIVRGLRRGRGFVRKLSRFLDEVRGEPAHDDEPEKPSLIQRVKDIQHRTGQIEARLGEHLQWHADTAGTAGTPVGNMANGHAAPPSQPARTRYPGQDLTP